MEKSYGNVLFQSGDITIKGCNVEFHSGTKVELGTKLNVELR